MVGGYGPAEADSEEDGLQADQYAANDASGYISADPGTTLQDEWEGVPKMEDNGIVNEAMEQRFSKYFGDGQVEDVGDGRLQMDEQSLQIVLEVENEQSSYQVERSAAADFDAKFDMTYAVGNQFMASGLMASTYSGKGAEDKRNVTLKMTKQDRSQSKNSIKDKTKEYVGQRKRSGQKSQGHAKALSG